MKRLACSVLIILLLALGIAAAGESFGSVYLTGDVNVRDKPGLDGSKITTIKAGNTLEYAGNQMADDRGVYWYRVYLTDGSTGWVSSNYAQLTENTYYVPDKSAADNDLYIGLADVSADKVFTRAQIESWYGVFDCSELINVTDVDISADGAMQELRVCFAGDVYWGGTDGYAEDWLATDGIMTEAKADIDSDGADELLVMYVDSQLSAEYGYEMITNRYVLAVYEPSGDGFRFADSMEIYPGNMNERFVRYIKGRGANYILQGNIGYWDGGSGGMNAVLYGYDGDKLYIAAVIKASTDESYALTDRYEPEQYEALIDALNGYDYDDGDAVRMGVDHGRNFIWVDGSYDVFDYDTGRLNMECFEGIDAVAEIAAEFGVEMCYTVEHGEWEEYTLYMNGGSDLFWADESFEVENGCVNIRLFGKLDYTGSK